MESDALEKPILPEFVEEWLESLKDESLKDNRVNLLSHIHSVKMDGEIKAYMDENPDTLMHAWLSLTRSDKPEKPILSDFVGSLMESYQEDGLSLLGLLHDHTYDDDELTSYIYEKPNELIQAWLFGFEKEDEIEYDRPKLILDLEGLDDSPSL